MKEVTYVIQDELGFHARPAGQFVKAAAKFRSKITLSGGKKAVDAKRIMAVMSTGIKKGTEVTLTIEGEDEDEAAAVLETFLRENL